MSVPGPTSQPRSEQDSVVHHIASEKDVSPAPAYTAVPPMSNSPPAVNQQDTSSPEDIKRSSESQKEDMERKGALGTCCCGIMIMECVMLLGACCAGC
ncbi:hypothetical protein TWF281_007944 [Arthrobotrys megalospora]